MHKNTINNLIGKIKLNALNLQIHSYTYEQIILFELPKMTFQIFTIFGQEMALSKYFF